MQRNPTPRAQYRTENSIILAVEHADLAAACHPSLCLPAALSFSAPRASTSLPSASVNVTFGRMGQQMLGVTQRG